MGVGWGWGGGRNIGCHRKGGESPGPGKGGSILVHVSTSALHGPII